MLPQGIQATKFPPFSYHSHDQFLNRLAMLNLLIHAQLGYLLHPSIKLSGAEKGGEPLRIADVGTGTG